MNTYFDGKQKYEVRRSDTGEAIKDGFTSQKKALEYIRTLKKDKKNDPAIRYCLWGYKDSERDPERKG